MQLSHRRKEPRTRAERARQVLHLAGQVEYSADRATVGALPPKKRHQTRCRGPRCNGAPTDVVALPLWQLDLIRRRRTCQPH